MIEIQAIITEVEYKPLLTKELKSFNIADLEQALSTTSTFILKFDENNKIALSWWVSPKRTRSYPYARVYDSLSSTYRRVTIIPFMKDEGIGGDRDFLQWDTISLMSLLNVYVIIAYYVDAIRHPQNPNKITKQRFDINYIMKKLEELLSYHSDALHWNIAQLNNIEEIGRRALRHYEKISEKTKVEMHSKENAERRMAEITKDLDFMKLSRKLAKEAQLRESQTRQPKENLSGEKGIITITNYLGGAYFFTCDEVDFIDENTIRLIEAKHTKGNKLPSLDDIKDGLLKMIILTNLKEVRINDKTYHHIPTLKLTTGEGFNFKNVNPRDLKILDKLKLEADTNKFQVTLNNVNLNEVIEMP